MKKRALVLFTLLLFILSGVVLQVYRLSDAYLSQAADQQGSVTVKVANSRGTIYDARLRPLTNAGEEYRLSVTPSPEASAALSGMLDAVSYTHLEGLRHRQRPAPQRGDGGVARLS